MAKAKDRKSVGYYTIKDILKEAKARFKIKDSYDDGAIDQYIRRTIPEIEQPTIFIDEKPIQFESLHDDEKKKYSKKPHYYTRNAVEVVLDKMYDYLFNKKGDKTSIDKPVHELIKENVEEIKAQNEQFQKKLDEAGLSREDYNNILNNSDNELVTLDELLFLGLKGMVFREDLTDEQLDSLAFFEQCKAQERYEEEHIERLVQQKTIEIMLTALFNEKYELDINLLREDIKTYVRQHGNIDGIVSINPRTFEQEYLNPFSDNIEEELINGNINLEPRRSYLRLQDARFYYTQKEDNNKK